MYICSNSNNGKQSFYLVSLSTDKTRFVTSKVSISFHLKGWGKTNLILNVENMAKSLNFISLIDEDEEDEDDEEDELYSPDPVFNAGSSSTTEPSGKYGDMGDLLPGINNIYKQTIEFE